MTLADAARIIHQAIQDRSYQRETTLGSSVAAYLAWKKLQASERALVIYEGYLARLCVSLAHLDPSVEEVTPEMLLDALAEYPTGSLRIVRTTYSAVVAPNERRVVPTTPASGTERFSAVCRDFRVSRPDGF